MTWHFVLRTIRRERLRSSLVLLLAGVPALLIGAGALVVPSVHAADVAYDRRATGQAQVRIVPNDAVSVADLIAKVSPNPTVVQQSGVVTLDRDGRKVSVQVRQEDLTDPILQGVVHLVSGALPHRKGEVLLSPSAASHLHVAVGGSVDGLRVVGIARDPNAWTDASAWTHPGSLTQLSQTSLLVAVKDPQSVIDLFTTQDGSSPVASASLSRTSFSASRYAVGGLTLVLAAVLVVALGTLLVSTALRVTASKAVLDLRLLHETGATRSTLTRLLVGQGLLLGGVAGLVGPLVGLPVGRLVLGPLQDVTNRELSTTRVSPSLVLLALALAVVASVTGALLASPATVREVTRAKAPRRAGRRTSDTTRWLAGLLAAVVGVGLFRISADRSIAFQGIDSIEQIALCGALVLIVALVLLAPATSVLWELLSRRLGPSARIAGREVRQRAGRHRLAAATVAVALGGLCGAATELAGHQAQDVADGRGQLPADIVQVYPSATPLTADVLRRLGAGHDVKAVAVEHYSTTINDQGTAVRANGTFVSARVTVVTPGIFELLGVEGDTAPLYAAVAAGRVVVNTDAPAVPNLIRSTPEGETGTQPIDTVSARWAHGDVLPDVVVPTEPGHVGDLGDGFIRLGHRVSRTELAELQRAAGAGDHNVQAEASYLPRGDSSAGPIAAFAAGAVLLVLLVALTSTALGAVDGRADAELLRRAGATGGTLRSLRAWRAGTVTAQGAITGGVLGTLAGLALADGDEVALVLSGRAVLVTVAAPLLVAALAWAAPARR